MKRENVAQTYGGCYFFRTADESQATADSQKMEDLDERQKKCPEGNVNKGNAVTKAQT
jgi:hypothetical protein